MNLDLSHENLTSEEVMAAYAAAEARRSKLLALLIAIVAHVLIVGALLFVVLAKPFAPEPSLIISAPYNPVEELEPAKKDLVQLKAQKPAAPSASVTQVVVAEAVSPLVAPVVDEFIENPMAVGIGDGSGFGMGLGGTGGGAGAGGSFFGTPAAGRSVILVIDVSTSMLSNCGQNGIEAIRAEITRTVNALDPRMRFNIICFGNYADAFSSKPVAATPASKKAAIAFMKDYYTGRFTRSRTGDNIDPKTPIPYVPIRPDDFESTEDTSGGSRYDMALIAAFAQQPETIFLLTDGQPSTQKNGNSLSKSEILDLVKDAAKEAYGATKPKVNGISVNGIGKDYLQEITRAFRGEYKEIEPKKLR